MEAVLEPSTTVSADVLPKLHCRVQRGDTIIADLIVTMPAAILADNKLFYFEIAATSDSTAHAIAGALSENRIDADWQLKGGPFSTDWKAIDVPAHMQIRDCRLEVPHFRGRLHHVAALDGSGELILADTDQTLWRKLRQRMTCPTLDKWCEALMPRIHRSGMLIPATTYGMDESLTAYVLAPDAAEAFDHIIGDYVRHICGFDCVERHYVPARRAA